MIFSACKVSTTSTVVETTVNYSLATSRESQRPKKCCMLLWNMWQLKAPDIRNQKITTSNESPTNAAAMKPNLSVVPSHSSCSWSLIVRRKNFSTRPKPLVKENAKVNLTNGATSQRWLRQKCHQSNGKYLNHKNATKLTNGEYLNQILWSPNIKLSQGRLFLCQTKWINIYIMIIICLF